MLAPSRRKRLLWPVAPVNDSRMKIDDARNLKAEIFAKVLGYTPVKGADETPRFVHPRALEASEIGGVFHAPEMDIAFGIAASSDRGCGNAPDMTLVGLVPNKKLLNHPVIERVNRAAKGEFRTLVTGPIRAQAFPLDVERPLRIGCSAGHCRTSGGSIGAFVKSSRHPRAVLSNNHVLAWTNRANAGDAVIQPARSDGGKDPRDRTGVVAEFIPIDFGVGAVNSVDAALSSIFPEYAISSDLTPDVPPNRLSGQVVDAMVDMPVHKIGRRTISTTGVVVAVELDQLMVEYQLGGTKLRARFDGQIAVSGLSNRGAFSKPGDSGALVFDDEGAGVGLHFAGSSVGGRNDRGLSFANPLARVLQAFDAELLS